MIYFDNAATTFPKPKIVMDSVVSAINFFGGNPGRGGHDIAMRASQKIYEVRQKVAQFFNAETENVIFTSNCTMSLNIAIKSLLKKGDHVITSSLEHNSVIRPLQLMKEKSFINYDLANIDEFNDDETISEFESLIKLSTKAIICTHSSNVSGVILPIKKIGELCKKHNILFIVDGAQSAGVIPIDIKEYNINMLCLPGHKGLYGISGSGILILNNCPNLSTMIEGGTGSNSVDLKQPLYFPDRFESGTLNTPGIMSIGSGIDFINKNGLDYIYNHEYHLCKKVYDTLKSFSEITLYTNNFIKGKNAPIVSFNIFNESSEKIVSLLNDKGFALRGGIHCSPTAHNFYGTIDSGMVRFSPSIFTKEIEVDKFLKNIQSICNK